MGNKSQLDWNYKKNCTMILEINKHNESFALTNGAATWFAKPDLWFLAIFLSRQTFHIIKYLQNPFSSVALPFSTNRLEQQFKGNLFKKLPLNNHYIALRKSFKFYPSALFLVWYAPCTTWSPIANVNKLCIALITAVFIKLMINLPANTWAIHWDLERFW